MELWEGVLRSNPLHVGALKALAELSTQTGQHSRAVSLWRQLVNLHSHIAALHNQLGLALVNDSRIDEALSSYQRAVEIDPNLSAGHYNHGMACLRKGEFGAAIASFSRAIALNPTHANYYFQLANATFLDGKIAESIELFNRALSLQEDPTYYYNRATAEAKLGDETAAVASLQKATEMQPAYVDALYNLGNAYCRQNELGQAIQTYERALSLNPGLADAHFRKGVALFLQGDLSNAWPLLEWRWKLTTECIEAPKVLSSTMWHGTESLQGKSILIYGEQGFGDTIHFSRYIPEVCRRGAKVYVEEDAAILTVIQTLDAEFEVIPRGGNLPETDYHCPLLSLPMVLQTTMETIPSPGAYMRSEPTQVEKWKTKLGRAVVPRVGLVWRGNPKHINDAQRSISLELLLKSLPSTGVEYIALQRDLSPAEIQLQAHTPQLRLFGDDIVDFSDTAAMCELVDIVLSVDTSAAHLAAALGRPTWLLLPFHPDWRWFLNRTDSPWYKSMQLFRQPRAGDWRQPLQHIADAIRSHIDRD